MAESQKADEALAFLQIPRIRELFIYLGWPDWLEIKHGGRARKAGEISHLWHLADDLHAFIDRGRAEIAAHVGRVSLYCSAIADFLGFYREEYKPARENLVLAAMGHDFGKLFPDILPLTAPGRVFTPADRLAMEEHVVNSLTFQTELKVSGIIGLHHNWQSRPYKPAGLEGALEDPEVVALSKLLGITDFVDSAATRRNTRFQTTKNLLTWGQVRAVVKEEYGQLEIRYAGDKLPSLNFSGGELISSLFDAGIFGRKDQLNPFPSPYSFIWRETPLQRLFEIIKAEYRQAEIKVKSKYYKYRFD